MRVLFFLLLGVAGAYLPFRYFLAAAPIPVREAYTGPAPKVAAQLQGTASCASVACHNSNANSGFLGREYKLFVARVPGQFEFLDKHLRSYDTLLSEKSLKILNNLDGGHSKSQPSSDQRCVRCHVHPDLKSDAVSTTLVDFDRPSFEISDGVSCEACHGNADNWLAQHFRPDWKNLPRAERKHSGMQETRNAVSRIRTCVRCHVGEGEDLDVNHDLYAAGHPEMKFDARIYHKNMPHHWDPRKDYDRAQGGRPDFDEYLGAVGDLVAAQASLKLLATHADEKKGKVWPEFADFRCTACHQNLDKPNQQKHSFRFDSAKVLKALGDLGIDDKALTSDLSKTDGWEGLQGPLAKFRLDRSKLQMQANKMAQQLETILNALEKDVPPAVPGVMSKREELVLPMRQEKDARDERADP